MSRIGKKTILLTDNVEVNIASGMVNVKGSKGILSVPVTDGFDLEINGTELIIVNKKGQELDALHGLYRALIANMVKGVSQGFEKNLEINGVGYRVQLQGNDLVFALGFSHPVTVSPPEGISFVVEGQTKIKVQGIDIQKVGQVAANIRRLRKPDAYKGKGVKYANEVIKKKQGKSAKK